MTVKNVADQRRAIVNNKYISKEILEQIKFELESFSVSNNIDESSSLLSLRT